MIKWNLDFILEAVALIAGGGGISAFLTLLFTRRERLGKAYGALAEAQCRIQDVIHKQGEEIRELSKENHELLRKIRHVSHINHVSADYIRHVGHWFEKVCQLSNNQLFAQIDKPRMPRELKEEIYQKGSLIDEITRK